MIKIPYEDDDDPLKKFNGIDVRLARLQAGYTSYASFAEACEVHPKRMWRIENGDIKKLPLSEIRKMIRVCNGGV